MLDRKATEHETRMHISKVGLERQIKDVLKDLGQDHLKVKDHAMRALQTATETLMRRLFEDSNLLCRDAGRVTVFPNDMEACLRVPEKEMLSPRQVSRSCKRLSGPTMLAHGGTDVLVQQPRRGNTHF